MTDEDLEVQCQLLTDTLCPEAEDPEGCAAGFHNWWALIGQYYFQGRIQDLVQGGGLKI